MGKIWSGWRASELKVAPEGVGRCIEAGFDQFWMTFDVFGTQKTGFRRPRIDTPLSILGKVPGVGFDPTTLRSHGLKSGAVNH